MQPLPGAEAFPAELAARLVVVLAGRAGEKPRTRHLADDGSALFCNRLLLESSPYLRQHAHNPVNWFPWGAEAFAEARRLGRPVLLSVGYATCHWCHVMEEESFEDEEIAAALNAGYVAIKVDREERPDVDAIYMAAVQAQTGSGGWPMTVWLTPEREPFWGGTYFPARDGARGARLGFLTLLRALAGSYHAEPQRVSAAAAELVAVIKEALAGEDRSTVPSAPGAEVLDRAAAAYQGAFDETWGGIGGAPKFPSSLPIRFLLRHQRLHPDGPWLDMATLTLDRMAAGGIRDQIDGGFHRYATDARWLVPHFEKMVYDNALLVPVFLEAYQASGKTAYADIARGVLAWMTTMMSADDGGFYAALDADSLAPDGRREEGWFYTWTPEEIDDAAGADAPAARDFFGVSAAGDMDGRSVLRSWREISDVAASVELPLAEAQASIARARRSLLAARARRPAPLRDEKILTAWNGLAISAFAQAALVLGEPAFATRAEQAAAFLVARLDSGGRLRRSFKDGQAGTLGYLSDYAFFIAGLLDLFEATGAVGWLDHAVALDQILADHFEDASGGFFLTSDEHEAGLAREKPAYDGAEPSGNSVEVMNLLRLHQLTLREEYLRRAERALGALGARLSASPAGLSELLLAVAYLRDVPRQIAIVTPRSRDEAEPYLASLRALHLPHRSLVVVSETEAPAVAARVPWLTGKVALRGTTTAYVCEQGVCALPSATPEDFARELLRSLRR